MTIKHLKRFAKGVAILGMLISGLMCLTQQTDSQSTARLLPNKDGGDPPPPGVVEPCIEVAPGACRSLGVSLDRDSSGKFDAFV